MGGLGWGGGGTLLGLPPKMRVTRGLSCLTSGRDGRVVAMVSKIWSVQGGKVRRGCLEVC